MICNFADKRLEAFWHAGTSRHISPDIHAPLRRKLRYLDAAAALVDLLMPPGNRLEALKGALTGWHSIRVNDQWRLVFHWKNDSIHDLKLMDYHR